MEFRILGPLQVLDDGGPLALGGERRRAMLAALVLHRNAPVSTEALIEEIWPDPPPSARTVVHGHVSALRRRLGQDDGRLISVDAGYLLRLADSELDAAGFDELFENGFRAFAAGEPEEAARLLAAAEGLWRGSALSDVELFGSAAPDVASLDDRRAEAREMRIEASLRFSRGRELIPELLSLARSEPLREPLHGYLATALYRTGRQAEALEVLRELRDRLRDELGIDPSPTIQVLETDILQQSIPLEPDHRGSAPDVGSEGAERRRMLVTTVVCGLGSAVASPLLERAEETLRSFGASVEVPSPGRIVGTFGLPIQSEDDALTAIRAALEITRGERFRAESEDRARIGVSTGWVTASGEQIIDTHTGARPIRTAATLSLVADAGQIVVTDLVRRVTEPAVSYRSISRPVPTGEAAFEVLPETDGSYPIEFDRDLFIGRDQELQLLGWALQRTERERQAHLATIVGPPGIGKSSVANALIDRIGARPNVLRGRCLHYGSGVPSWPIGEIVRAAAGILDGDDRAKARARIDSLLRNAKDSAEISAGIAAIAGLTDEPLRREEISSVVCRFLAHVGHEAPVVVVIDDLQWADTDLLQLLRAVVTNSQDVPLFVLCLARPELPEEHPDWSGGIANAMMVSLGPLSDGEVATLLGHLDTERVLEPGAIEHLLRVAGGNPLFLIETVRTIREQRLDAGGGDGIDRMNVVPPTLQGVLGARLSRLDANERRLLERASVIGQEFDTQALTPLLPEDLAASLPELIDRLLRRGLLQVSDQLPGTFRFRHLLIRDAAYMELTAELRAALHEAFARWDEDNAGERLQEIQEIIGYHLESAHAAQVEAGDSDPEQLAELAVRAARHLVAAGRRSLAVQESRAAANLLGRAAALLPESNGARPDVLCDWGAALMDFGEWESAHVALAEAIQAAEFHGDVPSLWRARLEEADLRSYRDPFSISATTMISLADEAIAELEPLGNRATHARALELKADALHLIGQAGLAVEAFRQAGDLAPEARRFSERHAAYGSIDGPAPVPGLIAELEEQGDSRDPYFLGALAYLYALDERFDQSRANAARALKGAEELGSRWMQGSVAMYAGSSLLLQAAHVEAEQVLRQAIRILDFIGDAGMMPTAAALLADAVLKQGRSAEALQWLERTMQTSTEDDVVSQVLWRRIRAGIDASKGALDHAFQLAIESVERADQTDWLNLRGDAHLELAQVQSVRDGPPTAQREAQIALDAYQRKGNRVGIGAAHRFLEILDSAS
jgi:DNA-binding SARP family transcriptional activator